ncbi:hypothetical protein ACIGZJ_34510 [Kitasatospora sp. NPDC052868]
MTTTSTAQPAQAPAVQGTHQYLLTMQKPLPNSGGYMVNTYAGH